MPQPSSAPVLSAGGPLGPLRLTRPTPSEVQDTVRQMAEAPFTYPDTGATLAGMPEGWHHDVQSGVVGAGDEAWTTAREALTHWTHFDLDWVWPHDRDVPLEPGRSFAFTSWQLGMWSVNVCRVVAVVDEPEADDPEVGARFGFAYGTVGAHALRGEELFLLERLRSGEVRFTIRKFSLPSHALVRAVLPLARMVQRRFSRDAIARVAREVAS